MGPPVVIAAPTYSSCGRDALRQPGWAPVLLDGIIENTTEDVGRFPIRLDEKMGVDVQRRGGVAVTEPAGNGADVDTGGKQSGGDVVPEVVEAHVLEAGLSAEAGRSG